MTPSVGTVIGERYRIEHVLGEGGMGKLFVAYDLRLERPVATKFLHEALTAADPKFAERFRQEALAACRIRHPAVVEIYDAGVHEGSPWLAMELLEGQTLGSQLAQRSLSVEETVWVALEVLDGLGAVHDSGFVHRDLKPDNLFLQRLARGRAQLKLLDFGIVKRVVGNEMTTLTATGATIGTPWYVSPEQAAGSKVLDHRSDLYSLGVILFECLTQRRPYEADSFGALITQFYTGAPVRLTDVMRDAHPGFADLLARLMSVDPAQRPPSAHSVIEQVVALGIAPRALILGSSSEPSARGARDTASGRSDPAAQSAQPRAGTLAMTELHVGPIRTPALQTTPRPAGRSVARWIGAGLLGCVMLGGASLGAWQLLRSQRAGAAKPASVAALATASTSASTGQPARPGSAQAQSTGAHAAHSLQDVGLRAEPSAGPPQVVVGSVRLVDGAGTFAPEVVDFALTRRADAFADCYRAALRTRADLSGRLDLRLALSTAGTVSFAEVTETTVGATVAECVLTTIRPLRFSPGPEGNSVTYACSMSFGFGTRPTGALAGDGRIGR